MHSFLKLGGKSAHRFRDSGRLLGEGFHHPFGQLRLVAHEFDRRNNERQVVIDVVPHFRQLVVELIKLRDIQSYWFARQGHFTITMR